MGIICELYIIDDQEIQILINSPNTFEDYLMNNYASVFGAKHIEDETVFSMDKAWDIAKFLIKQNDTSQTKILSKLDGLPILENSYTGYSYILSKEVKEISKYLQCIHSHDIINTNTATISDNFVYNSEWLQPENWSYILEHFYCFQNGFLKASEKNSGIVISIG